MAAKNGASTRKILGSKTSTLKVLLTEGEKKEVSEKLARAEGDLRDHVAKTKSIAADLKATKEEIDNRLRSLGQIARDGFEYRPVPVRIEADFAEGKVYEIREDLGEVVGTRAVTPQDRQGSLLDGPEAERAALELDADQRLENSGDGKLNDPKLKGPAQRSKKARTRSASEAGATAG